MNYIACADLHIRSNRPQFRKDDYFKTVCNKFRQIIALCNKYDADLIIAGDVFDSIRVGHKVVNTILDLLKKLKGKALVVAGQHDQVYHTKGLEGSPLFTLVLSGKVMLLNNKDPHFDGINNVYGCSFGEVPIKPESKDSILVIHKSITPDDPPFFLTDAISSEQALDTYEGYFLIISGDYHQSFTSQKWGNTLLNCGPMMRQSIDQTDIEPGVFLIDGKNNKSRFIKLKIEPSESVFALEDIANKESKFAEHLSEFVETLKNKKDLPDYKETVNLIMDSGKVSGKTRDKINSILGEVIDD